MNPVVAANPERMVRSAFLILVTGCAFAPLLQLGPRTQWWQQGWVFVLALFAAGAYSVDGELRPERADTWGAVRARRFAPAAVGLVVVASLAFPTFGAFWILWLLAAVNLLLLAWAFVPSVRCAALCVSSAGALGLTVIDDTATWTLLPVGLAWVLVPALDRMANARMRLPSRRAEAPGLLIALLTGIVAFAVGAGVFAGVSTFGPESTREFEIVDLLSTRARDPGTSTSPTPEVPALELFFLLIGSALALFVATHLSGSPSAEPAVLAPPRGMNADAPHGLTRAPKRSVPWPAGPRRELVRLYLEHRHRLVAHGVGDQAGSTPGAVADALPEPLRASGAALAARFARARWAKAAVGAEDLEAARTDAARIERDLGAQS